MNENKVTEADKRSLNSLIDELERSEKRLHKLVNINKELETVVSERRAVEESLKMNNKKSINKMQTLPKNSSSSLKVLTKSSSTFSVMQKPSQKLSESSSKSTITSRRSTLSNDFLERQVRMRIEDFHAIRIRLRKMNTCTSEEKTYFALLEKASK